MIMEKYSTDGSITVKQIKGARGILDWTQDQLAAAARISRAALNNLERGTTTPHADTLSRIQKALERAGIEFISGGCRLKEDTLDVQVFHGADALFRLYDDIIDTYTGTGGTICISGVDEKRFVEAGGERFHEYLKRFADLGIVDNLLARDGDTHLVVPAKYYRWVSEEIFSQVPYMVYGDKYAIIRWGPPVKIVLIQNAEIADSYRKQFKAHWRRGIAPPSAC
jgi:transcriptional regulator with XRE-family HTH domain